MDADRFVAISTVAKFNQVRRLTDDYNLVVEVLRGNKYFISLYFTYGSLTPLMRYKHEVKERWIHILLQWIASESS